MGAGTSSVSAGSSLAQFSSLSVGSSVSQVTSVAGRPKKVSVAPLTWTARAAPPANFNFRSSSVGNGSIVASAGTAIYTSTDGGHTFTSTASALSPTTIMAAYLGGSTFVMAAQSGKYYLSSNSGASWGASASFGGTFSTNNSVGAAGNPAGLGIVWGASNVWARTANAGSTWTSPGSGFTTTWYSVMWDGTQFVVVCNDGAPAVYTSTDLQTFTKQCALPSAYINSLLAFDSVSGVYIVAATAGTVAGVAVRAASTPAGLGSAADQILFTNDQFGVAIPLAGGGKLFVFDDIGDVLNSTDGVNWATGTLNMAGGDAASHVCYDSVNNSYCAAGAFHISTFP